MDEVRIDLEGHKGAFYGDEAILGLHTDLIYMFLYALVNCSNMPDIVHSLYVNSPSKILKM